MTSLTKRGGRKPLGVKPRDAERSKNFFALGLISLDVHPARPSRRSTGSTTKFGSKPQVRDANLAAFQAGHAFGETAELFDHPYEVKPATLAPGTYTQHHRQHRARPGASSPPASCAKLPVFLGSYPITPGSDILHELSKHKNFGVRTLQAEDEIAGIGVRARRRLRRPPRRSPRPAVPGVALKSETIGLAVSLELPLVIIDVQRGGPSTGLAHQDRAGRPAAGHVRPPRRVARCRSWRAYTPADCFYAAIEAARIALKYRTPVILLTDGYLANGAEPWRLPDVDDAARHLGAVRHRAEPRRRRRQRVVLALPPRPRDPRPAVGDPGHARARCTASAGIEKEDGSGNISYDPDNHERMVRLRAAKIAGIADDIPPVEVDGDATTPSSSSSAGARTWGAINGARRPGARRAASQVAHVHLTHLNPFPPNLGEVLPPLPEGPGARDEPGPALTPAAGRVPRRRQVAVSKVQGAAVHRRRARGARSSRSCED